MDDIRTGHAASQAEREAGLPPETGAEPASGRRRVAPEDEVRGGPEQPPPRQPGQAAGRKDGAEQAP